jgi:hypothetical protein
MEAANRSNESATCLFIKDNKDICVSSYKSRIYLRPFPCFSPLVLGHNGVVADDDEITFIREANENERAMMDFYIMKESTQERVVY